jgi:hypothetical protein
MRLRGNTYSPQNVAIVFRETNCPTPTDENHGADWWNTNFGRKIIYEWETKMKQFAKEIEEKRPNKSQVLLSFSNLQFPGLTDADHPVEWWQSKFAETIRQSFKDQIMMIFEDIQRMREVI